MFKNIIYVVYRIVESEMWKKGFKIWVIGFENFEYSW